MGLGGRRNARTGRVKRGVWDEKTGQLSFCFKASCPGIMES